MTAISKNKRFSRSFANAGTTKFKQNYATVENFKPFTYLTSQETALIFMNVIGPFAKKKIENLFFSENVMTGQSSSKHPGLSIRTVKSFNKVSLLKTPQRSKPQNHDYYVQNIRKDMKHGSSKRDIRIEIKVPTCVSVIIAIKY